jgi:predicted RecB family nuclease
MQILDGTLLASSSDIVNYLSCAHRTTLDLIDLETPLEKAPDDEQMVLVQERGRAHEAGFRAGLRKAGGLVEIAQEATLEEKLERTREAMRAGAGVIYQAALREGRFIGHADFLRRVEGKSGLGEWRYEVLDTKLALKTKAKFLIQLACYSDLVAAAQGVLPERAHLALGDGTEVHFRVQDYAHYYRNVRDRFLKHVAERPKTYPEPVEACALCHWRNRCAAQWEADDHLSRVAGIRKQQWRRLEAAGIRTIAALGVVPEGTRVARMADETLAKLRAQARLQAGAARAGERRHELLEGAPFRGFARLPAPSEGDIFFDMEGDPFEQDGLEYLFGVVCRDGAEWKFRRWWAHGRTEERAAFEGFMDFVAERLERFPDLHIYHYHHYEPSALKALMSKHGVREVELDDLLRGERFVDLYRVVREAVRISEPGYSLKDVEKFYAPPREGEVASAGASIVYYEKWRETNEQRLLDQIEAYNRFDCDSTRGLHEWLLKLRPAGLAWFTGRGSEEEEEKRRERSAKTLEHEAALERYRERLMGAAAANLPERERELRELVFYLLDFHRRADKPGWWEVFARRDMDEEELVEDAECIGGMVINAEAAPQRVKNSTVYTYRYPEQEFKLKAGDAVLRTDTAEPAGSIESIDEENRILRLKVGPSRPRPPERLSIGRQGPLGGEKIRPALFRLADALLAGGSRYRALRDLLLREAPRVRGRGGGAMTLENIYELDQSYLYIQGPPGAGKTWTGARLIVELLRRKKRIGISSNSHKAIHKLLAEVERVAGEKGVRFRGVKKASTQDPETKYESKTIANVYTNEEAAHSGAQLLAGTVWLFSDSVLDQTLDYLFVDEAGQVALANLVAMGVAAKNIVLLGDQMQLGQPIQGVHPGRSGESALEYLLDGLATIPIDRGVFLPDSWRMHPDVCGFISDAVYDSRLKAEAANAKQRLVLGPRTDARLKPTGLAFVPVAHDACAQKSEEEAAVVKELYASLLGQRVVDRTGVEKPVGAENILVVAPYNMQVNLLKRVLPEGARVGTVDKFQGQEAEAVLISMATSSGEYLPRNIEFLYSKNRFNVAVSRARSLAVLVASPKLLEVNCATPEQMALVNTLCWFVAEAENQIRGQSH